MATEVRDAREDEAGAIADLLARAAFGPAVARVLALPQASDDGAVLVCGPAGAPHGAVSCLSFGRTGWIGALGVAPPARRRGLGRALTEAAIARLREGGALTVLLFATDMGRPLYEGLGFESEGTAITWRGSAGVGPGGSVRRLREGDRAELARLDRDATGEDRVALLSRLRPLSGLAAVSGDELRGWAVRAPYGHGVGICADDDAAGVALIGAVAAGGESTTLVVPEVNASAAGLLRRWGFQPAPAAERMRLGPAVDWHPERQFGLFNLFWG
jgi:ribosomal protein S18 acetylase RimI-like enzyme